MSYLICNRTDAVIAVCNDRKAGPAEYATQRTIENAVGRKDLVNVKTCKVSNSREYRRGALLCGKVATLNHCGRYYVY